MRPFLVPVLSAAALAGAARAESPPPPPQAPAKAAIEGIQAKGHLTVTTPAFRAGGDIPFENTQYRANRFPGLAWTGAPRGTRTFVVMMQDVDRPIGGGKPLTHFSMIKLPAGVTRLEPGMTVPPSGAAFGPNFKGANQPWLGPHTPPGPKHRYHFQVFALDAAVPDPGASPDALVASLQGHVLADGEIVGLGQIDPEAAPK